MRKFNKVNYLAVFFTVFTVFCFGVSLASAQVVQAVRAVAIPQLNPSAVFAYSKWATTGNSTGHFGVFEKESSMSRVVEIDSVTAPGSVGIIGIYVDHETDPANKTAYVFYNKEIANSGSYDYLVQAIPVNGNPQKQTPKMLVSASSSLDNCTITGDAAKVYYGCINNINNQNSLYLVEIDYITNKKRTLNLNVGAARDTMNDLNIKLGVYNNRKKAVAVYGSHPVNRTAQWKDLYETVIDISNFKPDSTHKLLTTATATIRPDFYPQNGLGLDAKGSAVAFRADTQAGVFFSRIDPKTNIRTFKFIDNTMYIFDTVVDSSGSLFVFFHQDDYAWGPKFLKLHMYFAPIDTMIVKDYMIANKPGHSYHYSAIFNDFIGPKTNKDYNQLYMMYTERDPTTKRDHAKIRYIPSLASPHVVGDVDSIPTTMWWSYIANYALEGVRQ